MEIQKDYSESMLGEHNKLEEQAKASQQSEQDNVEPVQAQEQEAQAQQ